MTEGKSDLDCFANLSSDVRSVRLSSVKGILRSIKHNSKNAHRSVYLSCKRLFRGLGASNPSLRQGCFSTIVGFFKLLPSSFDLDVIIQIIEGELSSASSNSKLEEGEAYLGQCLAYGAMIVSEYILDKSEDEKASVFEKLFQLSRKRSYIHHASFVFMTILLKKTKNEYNPDGFIDYLKDLNTFTLDKLYYIVTLVELPHKSQTIKKVFGSKKLFDMNNAEKFAMLIKKNKSQKMLEHRFFLAFINNGLKYPEFVKCFWDVLCDSKNSSLENDIYSDRGRNSTDIFLLNLGKMILKQCALNQDYQIACKMFTDKFINMVLRNSKGERKLIQSVLQEFCHSIKIADDEVKIAVIKKILFEEGLLNFDQLTSSKTVLVISNSLTFNAIIELADEYKAILEFKKEVPKKEIESKNKAAIMCLSYLTKTINNPVCSNEISWRLSQLVYLLRLGFFKLPDLHFNREVNQNIQEAFLTSLGHRFPNLESFQQVIEGIVLHLKEMFQDPSISLVNPFTDEMNDSWTCALAVAKKIDKFINKDPSHKEILFVLKIILQYMAILLLKERSTAVTNINDLKNIFEDLTVKNNDKTMWIGVLVDLFLNLLSKPNYNHRHIIRCTFKFVCPHLTVDAFMQIVEVLDLSYESGVGEDDNDDEMEQDSLSEENKSDEGSDSSEDSGDEEEEMDEDLTGTEKLRLELRNALGGGSDNESIDLDDMDEEEGKRLDEALSSIFRANSKRRKTTNLSRYENQLAHFRTRVMDLIEICTEVVLPLSYWIKALPSIVDLFGSTIGQRNLDCLRSRISCFLKKLYSAKTITDEINVSEIVSILENLLDKLSKPSGIYADMKAELVQVLKFVLKASKPFKEGLQPKNIEKNVVYKCISNSLKNFFENKNSVPVQLFTGLTTIGWDGIFVMIPDILKYSFDENCKPHKRQIGLQILEIFVKTAQFFDGHLEKFYLPYINEVNEAFTKSVVEEIKNICNSGKVNMKYHSELWSVISVIINRQNNSQIPVMIDVGKVNDTLTCHINNFPTMKKKCKQSFLKVCNLLSVNKNGQPIKHSNEKSISQNENGANLISSKNLLKRKHKGDLIVKRKKKVKTTTLMSSP